MPRRTHLLELVDSLITNQTRLRQCSSVIAGAISSELGLRLCLPKTSSAAPNPRESGITRSTLIHADS